MTGVHQMRYPMTRTNQRAARDNEVLDAIRAFWSEHGYSPSYRDLCALTGVTSTAAIHATVRRLSAAGKIRHTAGRACSIVVAHDDRD